jgi:hypothetical protein
MTCPSESALKSIAALKAPFEQAALAVAAPELRLTVLPSSEQVPETAKALWLAKLMKAPALGLVMARLGAERSRTYVTLAVEQEEGFPAGSVARAKKT